MYQSKFREFKDSNIFTWEEKNLIEKFIEFDEKCFHRIDLNNREIYWSDTWELKIDYLQNTNNLLDFICNLYDVYNNHKIIFIKKKFHKPYRFIDFFFDWGEIYNFYGPTYEKHFSTIDKELKYIYEDEPEKFLQFIKKINEINKKDFLKNTENFKKIKYKMKKI